MVLPHSLRKLLHQHAVNLLHSQKAVAISLLTLILLVVSVIQFSDTVLEWSVDKYRMIEHTYSASDNILAKSFERQLCYTAPIDVVYTWVNGSDPWHQEQLELYKNGRLEEAGAAATWGRGKSGGELTGPTIREGELGNRNHPPGALKLTAQCGSSHCVQANAVLITPAISLPDLSEVFNDAPLDQIRAYNFSNQTFALTREGFDLDELLEDRSLVVNDRAFTFHSVHLTANLETDSAAMKCESMEFARMVLDVGVAVTEEGIKKAFPQSLQSGIRSVDFYQMKNLAIIYFSSESVTTENFSMVKGIEVDGREMRVVRVCLLEDIHPSASGNELRLSRFKDNEELRYSIRSLEKHAGWIRRIYIVTNGQVPYWLNFANPKVHIVTHQDIFVNKSHLPTFSSAAIEAHLHRIPGLSEKFLYFNDDVLLTQDVLPEDFFSHSEGYKVHLSWHVPACAEGCPSGWIRDGFCDATCNNDMCNFDGGDCVNKTTIPDMDDDDSDMKEFQYTGTCHPGCLNAWLADRYCDTVCNHQECGFDAGDCGLEKLAKFPHIWLTEGETIYRSPVGQSVVVFNASALYNGRNMTLKEGNYKQAKGIRTVSVYPQKQTIVVILFSNATGSSVFTLSYADPASATTVFEFTLHFDSSPLPAREDADEMEDATGRGFTFPTAPADLRGPKPVSAGTSAPNSPRGANLTVEQLTEMFRAGELTEYGFERRKAALLGVPMNSSYTRPATLPSTVLSTFLPSTSPAGEEEHAPGHHRQHSTARWGRATTRSTYAKARSAKDALKYKDAYADSLRYVNRLYNNAFGIEARKVPAHIPHYVDRSVMAALQEKFAAEFDATSGTRVRSPRDMQFAFSYLHYVMNSQDELQMGEIFDEIDTDHSGTWNEREIYLAAVRSSDDDVTDAKLSSFTSAVVNCSNVAVAVSDSGTRSSLTLSNRETSDQLEVAKQDIVACDAVRTGLLAQLGKRKRFKYRTSADMEAFTFIRVGNNVTLVQKHLQEVLRHPKKFICLNDEVDYTREDSATVQAAIHHFFQTLYPIPSSFELPPKHRNHFSHIGELRSWQRHADLFRSALIGSAGIVLLIFSCLLFPRRRRLIFRRIRMWMRNRDIDRAVILHT